MRLHHSRRPRSACLALPHRRLQSLLAAGMPAGTKFTFDPPLRAATLKQKYKIQKKISQHLKKKRREERKAAKQPGNTKVSPFSQRRAPIATAPHPPFRPDCTPLLSSAASLRPPLLPLTP